jgi:hypothetical protein
MGIFSLFQIHVSYSLNENALKFINRYVSFYLQLGALNDYHHHHHHQEQQQQQQGNKGKEKERIQSGEGQR